MEGEAFPDDGKVQDETTWRKMLKIFKKKANSSSDGVQLKGIAPSQRPTVR